MITSRRAFLIELYKEYLEEASFLYEQRLALFLNPEITWKKIGEFENRLEAHIDGLVIGETLALDICTQQALGGDFGELYAAVRVFCRQNRRDLLLNVLGQLDGEASNKTQAIADALKHELPQSWHSDLLSLLRSSDPQLVLIALEIIGYRRLKESRDLVRLLEKSTPQVLAKTIWALGRVGEQKAMTSIFPYLADEEEPVRSAAALALLRTQDERALYYCQQHANEGQWAILPVALGGSRVAFELLLSQARIGAASSECLIGLGLLGCPAAIPTLISYLNNDKTATAAANSLERISGARLQEIVFVPEELDEDEMFPEEREQLKQGQMPTRMDGRPFGSLVNRVSRKRDEWQQWWDKHGSCMDPFARFRNGVPYSPECLVSDLERETTPHDARRLTYEELVVRYGFDIPFEVDMFVAQQMNTLVSASNWARQQEPHFVSGRSYFAGKLTD